MYSVNEGTTVRTATKIGCQSSIKRCRVFLGRTGADGFSVGGAEHMVFVPIRQIPCLTDKCGRNLTCKSGIVDRLHGNVVVNLPIKSIRRGHKESRLELTFH
jgi:hypothetical protein